MTRKLGENYRLFISDGAGTPAFTEIAGQRGLSIDRSTNSFPISAKGDAYDHQAQGKQSLTITCNGVQDLPDTDGLEEVLAVSLARTAREYQIRHNPFGDTDVKFQGSMYTSGLSEEMTDEQSADYSFQCTTAADPTADTLS